MLFWSQIDWILKRKPRKKRALCYEGLPSKTQTLAPSSIPREGRGVSCCLAFRRDSFHRDTAKHDDIETQGILKTPWVKITFGRTPPSKGSGRQVWGLVLSANTSIKKPSWFSRPCIYIRRESKVHVRNAGPVLSTFSEWYLFHVVPALLHSHWCSGINGQLAEFLFPDTYFHFPHIFPMHCEPLPNSIGP